MQDLVFGFKTDTGRARSVNRDHLAALDETQLASSARGLFVIADGLGSARGSDQASQTAVETVATTIRVRLPACIEDTAHTDTALEDLLRASLQEANAAVWQLRRALRATENMGTTCVLALVRDNSLLVGNVGDSRCYLLRAGHFLQLTQDHAYLDAARPRRDKTNGAEGRVNFRYVMTRALGFAPQVEPEVERFALHDGDVLLLCSDGLSNLLSETEIIERLTSRESPQQVCENLVAQANANGGDDNISVIVAHIGPPVPEKAVPLHTREAPLATGDSLPASRRSWRLRLRHLLGR